MAEIQTTAGIKEPAVTIFEKPDWSSTFHHIASKGQLRNAALIPIEWAPTVIDCLCYDENDVFIDVDQFKSHIIEIYYKNGASKEPFFLLKKDCEKEKADARQWLSLKNPDRDLIISRDKLAGIYHPLLLVVEDRSRFGEPRNYLSANDKLFRFDITNYDRYCFGKCHNQPTEDTFVICCSPLVHI